MTWSSRNLSIQYNNPTNLKETDKIMSKIAAIIFDGNHIEKIVKFNISGSGDAESKGNNK